MVNIEINEFVVIMVVYGILGAIAIIGAILAILFELYISNKNKQHKNESINNYFGW